MGMQEMRCDTEQWSGGIQLLGTLCCSPCSYCQPGNMCWFLP